MRQHLKMSGTSFRVDETYITVGQSGKYLYRRFVKKKVRASQCFKHCHTAERTLEGVAAVNMLRKGQVKRLAGSDKIGRGEVRCFALPERRLRKSRW